MAYILKYIKNPATAEDLIRLYESALYEKLVSQFSIKTKVNLVDKYDKQLIRQVIERNYLILNIPLEEVISEMKLHNTQFLKFCIARSNFYNDYIEENPDGEFPEGEELDEDEKSEVINEDGMSKSFLLNMFCEFYLLKSEDKERLFHYLKTTRMPFAKKHQAEITGIYNP